MKHLSILALFALFFSGSCKKEEPPKKLELPPYTQEGKNIFACKINGNIFIVEGKKHPVGNSYGINYGKNNDDGMSNITAQVDKPFDADIFIRFMHLQGKTLFVLNGDERNSAELYMHVPNRVLAETSYTTTSTNAGNINLLYYQNNIIAGTFEFDAISEYGDTVHVTEGRFDISTVK